MSDPAQMPAIRLCDQRGGISQIARRESAMAHARAVGFHGELSMSFNRIEFVGCRPFNLCAGPHSMLAMADFHIVAATSHIAQNTIAKQCSGVAWCCRWWKPSRESCLSWASGFIRIIALLCFPPVSLVLVRSIRLRICSKQNCHSRLLAKGEFFADHFTLYWTGPRRPFAYEHGTALND